MSYDPKSLLGELEHYQKQADEACYGNIQYHDDFHPYGSTVARETTGEAPSTIEIDTCDDIAPLRIYITDGPIYELESINGSQLIYRYYSE